ncbi:TetR/AcrR family transcriptional regulator [Demequina sp. SYSU T00192]|uniref:TetR/AcrR family transcriptional regulator n=1 Tax=Demequina litoralis TaxID=3051660 RepID=A0ABT8G710_9MICO|nr:TetR/AcrR family transcriptional regulator [Demequina sp. SYSU T00192]MDN4474852.1 TetR/AcrR family transcriptional regulator [Demequina sp. SYSU T00192]
MSAKTGRARPMSPEARREQILDAAVPLLLERGAEVTTRELADAAGIAEGTVFRAFPDKDALIDAAIARVMDPTEILAFLDGVDPALSLEAKIEVIVSALHGRVSGVVRFMTALGPREHARHTGSDGHGHRKPPLAEATGVVERLLAPDAARLRVPVATAVDYLRILVFGTTMPFLTTGGASDPSELADFILHGIAKEGD